MTDNLHILNEMLPISVVNMRKEMGEVFGQVHFNNRDTLVTSHGKPMVVLVSPSDYLELMHMKQVLEEAMPRRAPNGKILLKIDPENQIRAPRCKPRTKKEKTGE